MMPADSDSPRVVSMFTGVGGLDLGLRRAGATTVSMCESWAPARRVLDAQFPGIEVAATVEGLQPDRDYEILAAGFPCTDLSHAGGKAGIFGAQSGLVEHVFRIAGQTRPTWIVLENVPNLLHLHRGQGIRTVTDRLAGLGYRWAYRTVDSRFTGVPQRRHRVILIASRDHDPAAHLFAADARTAPAAQEATDRAWGFYWTEGRNGLGLVQGAVPTLKGGSTIGLPSAPAVWLPDAVPGRKFLLPSISAGEMLQGFESGWTNAARVDGERDLRWKLIGNAVTVGVGEWVGRRLIEEPATHVAPTGEPFDRSRSWPDAAHGGPQLTAVAVAASRWPDQVIGQALGDLVDDAWVPLSHRATKGFLSRVDESRRTLPHEFAADLEEHLQSAPRKRNAQPSIEDRLAEAIADEGLQVRRDVRPEPDVPHRLDLVVSDRRFAVDVRSCFWHGCPHHMPAELADNPRWMAKRARVVQRDENMEAMAVERGWTVHVVWAHEDLTSAGQSAMESLRRRRDARTRRGRIIGNLADLHEIAASRGHRLSPDVEASIVEIPAVEAEPGPDDVVAATG